MSATSMQRVPVSASAAAMPSSRPATMSTSDAPAARWRAGVKKLSAYTRPWAAASVTLS